MKATKIDVELLRQELKALPNLRPTFKLNTTRDDATALIYTHYQNIVWRRGDNFVESGDTINNVARLAAWLTNKDSPNFGAYICGNCGNGKTTLLEALQHSIAYLYKRYNPFEDDHKRTGGRNDVIIIGARGLANLAKTNFEEFEKLIQKNVVCVDDAGTEPAETLNYGTAVNPMAELIEYRNARQLCTLITSNLTLGEFADKYGERVRDRMKKMDKIIFKNESYR